MGGGGRSVGPLGGGGGMGVLQAPPSPPAVPFLGIEIHGGGEGVLLQAPPPPHSALFGGSSFPPPLTPSQCPFRGLRRLVLFGGGGGGCIALLRPTPLSPPPICGAGRGGEGGCWGPRNAVCPPQTAPHLRPSSPCAPPLRSPHPPPPPFRSRPSSSFLPPPISTQCPLPFPLSFYGAERGGAELPPPPFPLCFGGGEGGNGRMEF